MTQPYSSPYVASNGNGVTTVFGFPHFIMAASEVLVQLWTGTSFITQTLNVNYSISGAIPGSAVSVVMVVPPAVGHVLVLTRTTEYSQSADIINSGSAAPRTLEGVEDKTVRMIQELAVKVARAIVMPLYSIYPSFNFPDPSDGSVIGWSGNTLVNVALEGWLFGSAVPTALVGVSGNFYIRTTTGDVYHRSGSVWTLLFNMTGPPGVGTTTGSSNLVARSMGGVVNAETGLSGLGLTSYTRYDLITVFPGFDNTIPDPTFSLDAIGALPIKSPDGSAIAAGDWNTSHWYTLMLWGSTPTVTQLRIVNGF